LDVNPLNRLKHGITLYTACMATMATLALGLPCQADCHAHYTQAVTLLDGTTQKANANQHPNPEIFSNDFKAAIDKLQAEKCMPELMNLIQHIQTEQKKLPHPSGPPAKPAPVMD
jgi:hypothetical protein